jgi:hypothetical protein
VVAASGTLWPRFLSNMSQDLLESHVVCVWVGFSDCLSQVVLV